MNVRWVLPASAGAPLRDPPERPWRLFPADDRPPITGLLIDPENVLYDATLWRRWLRQVLVRMGVAATFPDFFVPWDRGFRREVDLGRCEFWEAFGKFLSQAGLTAGQIAEVLAAGKRRKSRFESEVRPLPGVKETLERIAAAGVALYVLTNAARTFDDLAGDFEVLGLPNVFHAGATSLDLGRVMPSSRSYCQALTRFGLAASETLFVAGQSRLLKGAQRCGMQTAGFNEDRVSPGAVSLERFSDLTRLIPMPLAIRRAG
jgi:FMN phosphatase YigB (HAD superfamily)